ENSTIQALHTTPISVGAGRSPQLLSNLASISRTTGPANITHYNASRTYDVQANVDGTDLASVASGVERIVEQAKEHLPRGAVVTRLRPVIMTALAMIIGMLPMSLGLGDGGEQNAPLARAVIGGLSLATVTTLFFVPVMYSILRHKPPVEDEEAKAI